MKLRMRTGKRSLIMLIFSLLLLRLSRKRINSYALKIKHIAIFLIPFYPVVVFLFRNMLLFNAFSWSLPFFNQEAGIAATLINQAGIVKRLPLNILNTLHWDVLFISLNLGAIFLVPSIIGFFSIVRNFVNRQSDKKNYFILISFLLILIGLWSWVFETRYISSEIRRLYYFAPFFAWCLFSRYSC